MLIAQAVFLLEHGQTDRQTQLIAIQPALELFNYLLLVINKTMHKQQAVCRKLKCIFLKNDNMAMTMVTTITILHP